MVQRYTPAFLALSLFLVQGTTAHAFQWPTPKPPEPALSVETDSFGHQLHDDVDRVKTLLSGLFDRLATPSESAPDGATVPDTTPGQTADHGPEAVDDPTTPDFFASLRESVAKIGDLLPAPAPQAVAEKPPAVPESPMETSVPTAGPGASLAERFSRGLKNLFTPSEPAIQTAEAAVAPPVEPVPAPAVATEPEPPLAERISRGLKDFFASLMEETNTAASVSEPEATAAATPETPTEPAGMADGIPDDVHNAVRLASLDASVPPIRPKTVDELPALPLDLSHALALGDDAPNAESRARACLARERSSVLFCLRSIDWPDTLSGLFDRSNKAQMRGQAVIRYDGERASSIHTLFPTDAFDAMVAHFSERFGRPTDRWIRRLSPFGQPKRDNEVVAWRTRDALTGRVMVLEIRAFDDAREAFPDLKHGTVKLRYADADPIFPLLSPLDILGLEPIGG